VCHVERDWQLSRCVNTFLTILKNRSQAYYSFKRELVLMEPIISFSGQPKEALIRNNSYLEEDLWYGA
jgi:hypothetical protein